MLTALLFSAVLTSSEMRSFMSLPGREEQKTVSLEISVPAVLAEMDQTATWVYPVSHQIFDQVPLVTKKDRASACPAIS